MNENANGERVVVLVLCDTIHDFEFWKPKRPMRRSPMPLWIIAELFLSLWVTVELFWQASQVHL